MITVTVRLYSILRHRDGRVVDKLVRELEDGSTLEDLLVNLKIQDEKDILAAVNGKTASLNIRLGDGDSVALMPLISGGLS